MFSEERLSVNGCEIRLRRAGEGLPLLYLHGANGVPAVPQFLQALTGQFQVLVPEHPGFGESDDPAWLEEMADLAYFYLDTLDQLGLSGVRLVGSSLGGWLALEMAVRQPQRFAALALIGSAGLAPEPGGEPGANIFRLAPEAMARHTFHGEAWVQGALAQPLDAETAAKNRHTITRLGWQPRLHDPRLHKRLHRLRMPVMLAWGEQDRITPLAQAAAFQRHLPQARLQRYPDCGHLPQVEQQDAFTRDLQRFLDGVPRERSTP